MIRATEERTLLAWVTAQHRRSMDLVHAHNRRRLILQDAASQLRTGRPASIVRAILESAGGVADAPKG